MNIDNFQPASTLIEGGAHGTERLRETLLTRHIGPMARILTDRTLKRTGTGQALLKKVARDNPDPAQRAAFPAGK